MPDLVIATWILPMVAKSIYGRTSHRAVRVATRALQARCVGRANALLLAVEVALQRVKAPATTCSATPVIAAHAVMLALRAKRVSRALARSNASGAMCSAQMAVSICSETTPTVADATWRVQRVNAALAAHVWKNVVGN